MYRKIIEFTFVFIAGLFFVACQAAESSTGEIIVADAWGRPSPMAADNGVFYMNITNQTGTADALTSASTEACEAVELHEGYMKENGSMGMRPVLGDMIDLPTSETINLKPGGLHVMCIGKTIPFDVGISVTLNLTFEQAGDLSITVPIQEK